ncbi:MAG TPA: DUF177 domain-containing protein [Methylomirabilota bacterium]|nr:DUF177 domain-containing protein [Methylomirabilota bacterium]
MAQFDEKSFILSKLSGFSVMVIKVSEIPDEGIRVEGVEAVPAPFADPTWELRALSLFVKKDRADVLVEGSLEARVPQLCGRCLEAFPFLVKSHLSVRYAPKPVRKDEIELTSDDLEVDFYDQDTLDLTTLVRTETLLALPMKPLCREECQGFCPVCGGNRNISLCACQVKLSDPRLEVLRGLAERLHAQPRKG